MIMHIPPCLKHIWLNCLEIPSCYLRIYSIWYKQRVETIIFSVENILIKTMTISQVNIPGDLFFFLRYPFLCYSIRYFILNIFLPFLTFSQSVLVHFHFFDKYLSALIIYQIHYRLTFVFTDTRRDYKH